MEEKELCQFFVEPSHIEGDFTPEYYPANELADTFLRILNVDYLVRRDLVTLKTYTGFDWEVVPKE